MPDDLWKIPRESRFCAISTARSARIIHAKYFRKNVYTRDENKKNEELEVQDESDEK